MKQRIILFGLILVGTVTFAQSPVEKGLNTINRSSAEATIGFLASNELQGREAGFHGSYSIYLTMDGNPTSERKLLPVF